MLCKKEVFDTSHPQISGFICLVQLFDQNGFRFDVLLSVSELVELQTDLESFESSRTYFPHYQDLTSAL